jgi:tRNA(fMet)-specific endonuclease VapC
MAVVLLDTSVASLFMRHRLRGAIRALYEPHLVGNSLALSFQSVAEIWKLAFGRRWGRRRCDELDAFLRRFLIIPYDYERARVWARLSVEAQRAGRRLETGDAWIAATAVHRRLMLFTHDRDLRDLPVSGLTVVSFA